MDALTVFSKIDSLCEEYTALWKRVCEIESPSNDKEGVDAVGACFLEIAKARGWQIETLFCQAAGNPLCLTMNKDALGEPIVFSGHMDTVFPKGLFGYPAVRTEGDRILGPGVCDCKGGIVAATLAMVALEELGYDKRPIRLILQSDEEVSSTLSEKKTIEFMAEHSKDAVAFINCEPPGSEALITVERKGIARYELLITGRAAHSSKCYEGASAIAEAAHKILELEKWKDPDGITCNCGVIEGGDTANTVPSTCRLIADIRYRAGQEKAVEDGIRAIADRSYIEGTSCALSLKSARVPMEKTEKNLALFGRINEIFTDLGLGEHKPYSANGGADSSYMTAYGIPTVDSLGTLGGRMHSVEEFSYLSALPKAAKKLSAIALYL